MDDKQLQAQAAFSKASQPAIDASLNLRFSFLFSHPYANLQHFIIFFLGTVQNHPGKLYGHRQPVPRLTTAGQFHSVCHLSRYSRPSSVAIYQRNISIFGAGFEMKSPKEALISATGGDWLNSLPSAGRSRFPDQLHTTLRLRAVGCCR